MITLVTGTGTHNKNRSVDKIQVETSHSKAPFIMASVSKNPVVGRLFANPF